jgi:short-subunit dehydrogenase
MKVLVTGASSGIGKAMLPLFAKDKHDLVLVARRGDVLKQHKGDLERVYGVHVDDVAMDLARPGAARALFERTGPVDVLVNNAGFGLYGLFHEQPLEKQQEMMALNVVALAELTRLYLEPMRARGSGRILQVASTAAYQPGPRMALYYATKAFVLSLSEALSYELHGTGVTVTTLCPGPTKSEFNESASYATPPLAERAMMTSDAVAAVGYRALWAGERTAIAGTGNKVAAVVSQVAPRALVLRVTDRIMRARGD